MPGAKFIHFISRSDEVTFYPSDPSGDGDGPDVVFIVVISVVSVLFVVLIITCVSYHCLRKARDQCYKTFFSGSPTNR
jgi:hypothetical protein